MTNHSNSPVAIQFHAHDAITPLLELASATENMRCAPEDRHDEADGEEPTLPEEETTRHDVFSTATKHATKGI
jgi:hypothetical protein